MQIIACSLFVFVLFSAKAQAAPATFTVINTADSGAGSFRQAIIDANGNGNPADMDVIEFNIVGAGVKTILASSQFPDITQKVTINGYSQPGSSVNTAPSPQPLNGTILIELDGGDVALHYFQISITAEDTIIRGLNAHGCSASEGSGCFIVDAENVSLQGNYLGTMPDGITPVSTLENISVAITANGDNVLIGGNTPADRNLIVNSAFGSQAISSSGNSGRFYGNYIGLAKDGVTGIGSAGGIALNGNNNLVGGILPGQRNIISGNDNANVLITGVGNSVQGNYICTDYTGKANASLITEGGVIFSIGASENIVGGISPAEANIISGCSGTGIGNIHITIPDIPLDGWPTGNSFLGNNIFAIIESTNGYSYPNKSGIEFPHGTDTDSNFLPDLFEIEGQTNDLGDTDTGTNGLINSPVINSVEQSGNQITFNYDLDALDSPTNQYRIEFFGNDADQIASENRSFAQRFIGTETVTPGNNKQATFTLPSNSSLNGNLFGATATAIDASTSFGFGSTSKLSLAAQLDSPDSTSSSADVGLANTGQNKYWLGILAIIIIIVSGTIIFTKGLSYHKKSKNIKLRG